MLQALKKTVILEAIERENTSAGGLILQGADDRQTEGRILSVGPKSDCGLKVGDRVLVDWTRVGKMSHDDKTYYVTDQSNIMAVFED